MPKLINRYIMRCPLIRPLIPETSYESKIDRNEYPGTKRTKFSENTSLDLKCHFHRKTCLNFSSKKVGRGTVVPLKCVSFKHFKFLFRWRWNFRDSCQFVFFLLNKNNNKLTTIAEISSLSEQRFEMLKRNTL